jgi:ATP-binding cassette subfamily G (WHITE) protein 2 (PDR)
LQYLSPNPRETSRLLHQEILLGDSVLQCWDNSTRGLDSVNALDFIKTLRKRTSESGSVAIVTLYQAGEDIYKVRKVPVEDNCRCLYI